MNNDCRNTDKQGCRADGAFYIAIIVAVVVAYANTLLNGFVYDDIEQILRNPMIRKLSNLPYFFFHDVWSFADIGASNYYRPVMYVVFTVEYALFGLKPWGYHLVNVVLHAFNAILVYRLGSEIFRSLMKEEDENKLKIAALVGALIFALHTVNVESVAWISAVPELTYTFFVLLSLYFYVTADGRHDWRLLCSVSAFFAAAFCKETSFALPLLVVFYDVALHGRNFLSRERLVSYFFYFVAGCLYMAFRFGAIEGFAPDVNYSNITMFESVLNIFPLFLKYMGMLLLPVGLSVYHDFSPVRAVNLPVVSGLLAVIIYVFVLLRTRKQSPVVFFLFLLMCVPLLPVFYIKGLGYNVFTERYLYLSSSGFALLVAYFCLMAHKRGFFGRNTTALIAVVLGGAAFFYLVGTVSQNTVWRDNYVLWSNALSKADNKCVPYNSYALEYLGSGRTAEAKKIFEGAVKEEPECPQVHTNLGFILMQEGRLDDAERLYQRAIELEPGRPLNYFNLGLVRRHQGRLKEAVALYVESLRINADAFVRRRELHWTVMQLRDERKKKR